MRGMGVRGKGETTNLWKSGKLSYKELGEKDE